MHWARRAASRRLNGGEQQGDQHRDNRNDDQQLDQSERGTGDAAFHRKVFKNGGGGRRGGPSRTGPMLLALRLSRKSCS